jgi:hypothetical protein
MASTAYLKKRTDDRTAAKINNMALKVTTPRPPFEPPEQCSHQMLSSNGLFQHMLIMNSHVLVIT